MWVRGVPYDEFAASYVNGAVIQVDGQVSPARLERVGDETGRVDVVVPDDEHSFHGGPPAPLRSMSFGAKLYSMISAVDLTDLDMWVRGVPYDEFAASYVNGAVIPVDGSAAAVDVGTLPFDPRIEVRGYDGS